MTCYYGSYWSIIPLFLIVVNYTLINMFIPIFTFGFHNVHLSISSGMQFEDSAPFMFVYLLYQKNALWSKTSEVTIQI